MKMSDKDFKKYLTPVGGGKYVTTTSDGVLLTLHTGGWIVPITKRLTNYVIEYEEEKE